MAAESETSTFGVRSQGRVARVFRFIQRRRSLALGGLFVGIIVLAAIFAPLITHVDPTAQDLLYSLMPPSPDHPFGTDAYGRDILARVVYGARISLVEVFLGVGIAVAAGVPLGLISGTLGGRIDQAIMWVMDIIFAFPGVILAILIVSILGTSLVNMLIAIAIFSLPIYARLSRNVTLGIKRMEYVEAASALGASTLRIMVDHILRNSLGPIIVQATLTAGTVILTAASLSFLGLGAQPPLPEWGAMMSDGRDYIQVALWVSLFPGLAITITVLGFNILGDGLRDLLDPRT
ncbi:MAG TPA: ABC transporter permease [Devosiaceae bacterium]|jgi:glutathione transport system permease protein